MRLRHFLRLTSVGFVFLTLIGSASLVRADAASDWADALAKGQQYLFNTFNSVDDDTGNWTPGNHSSRVGETAIAASALIETGKISDPAYKAIIDKAINYIKAEQDDTTGCIGSQTYETGLAVVALSLYGSNVAMTAGELEPYQTVVRNAINCQKSYQNIAGSTHGADMNPDGSGTPTNANGCPFNTAHYGGWGYGGYCDSADMSNTQFAAIGIYYGSKFLGDGIKGTAWANGLLEFLRLRQMTGENTDDNPNGGAFGVYSRDESSRFLTGTGGGLWILTMIDEISAKQDAADAGTMVQRAVDWYTRNYTWTYGDAQYYFIYAMAKGLTATVGDLVLSGTETWTTDLRAYLNANKTEVAASDTTPESNYWSGSDWLDPGPVGTTGWALMSMALSDVNTPSATKPLADVPETTLPEVNRGTVWLETTGGVTISLPARADISPANAVATGVEMPIGSFEFTLNGVTGATTVLKIVPPAGTLDPANSITGFLNADGSIKAGLTWFKLAGGVGGAWTGLPNVPIKLGPDGGPYTYIEVTLTDNGEEDADPTVGVIRDPGAPGVGFVASVDDADGGGNGNCFIATAAYGSNMAGDVMLLRKFRDNVLLTNAFGRMLVDTYYAVSPPIAAFIADHAVLRATTRAVLAPIVFTVKYPWGTLGILILAGLFAGFMVRRQGHAA